MSLTTQQQNTWSIVLAAGDGERLKPFVRQWLGYEKPKQYCAFVGTRSMLQHTLDRADEITPSQRKVIVVARQHRERGWPQGLKLRGGRLIVQPTNQGTASAIFLALTYIRQEAPSAKVILYPSDHFIYPEMRFQAVVRAAIAAADALPQKVVLLGVAANRPELDYGWIQPGSELRKIEGHSVKTAIRFKEKPAFESGAQAASTAGGLWNTLVLAAQAELLWSLGQRRFPKLMEMLEQFAPNIGNEDEEEQLNILYRKLGNHDFSSELLEKLPHQIAVIELDGVVWSDWGRPERIRESLGQMGKSLSLSRAYAKIG